MPDSLQHKLDRVRPPRVQITYDVELGGAIQKKELPFVVGIVADLCGRPKDAPAPMKERKFVDIDRDNFNDVLASIAPRLALQVDNKLSKAGGSQNLELTFRHIDDFGPLNVIQQVESLRKLYEIRQRLSDLLTKLDGNEKLDALLTQVGRDTEALKKVKAAIGDGGAR
jgi:type VI secretion system ImpB/VipA family protein